MKESLLKNQILPLALTVVVFGILVGILRLEIGLLNHATGSEDILTHVRWADVLVGLVIYLKTSIDFAIYIGRLMAKNTGWRSRVAIEIGTAFGNALGTLAILLIWTFFKEVKWLLAAMVFLAALVLFKLAEEGLEHAQDEDGKYPRIFQKAVSTFEHILRRINKVILPILKYVIPDMKKEGGANLAFWPLFGLSFTIPFILGLDDFAGYVPLFSIVNIFGFAIGVFAGHMILNILLYISPERTTKAVKNPIISFVGSLAFVGLAIWGLVEVTKIIGH